jgi:Tfp pilus assembly protein PilZ
MWGPRSHQSRHSVAAMTKKRQGREHRRDRRIAVSQGLWVAWRTDGSARVSRVRDLSAGGVFISTDSAPSQGSEIHLLFSLPEGEIRIEGRVRYANRQAGMGVEFSRMTDADRARLKELIGRLKT